MQGVRIRVLLSTEGTFPFYPGGVSTWADIILKGMPDLDFCIYAVMMNPFAQIRYPLPENVRRLVRVPLWGTEDPSEHLTDRPFSSVYAAKLRTGEHEISRYFIPLFSRLIEDLLSTELPEASTADTMNRLYEYFQEYDYLLSFKSRQTWEEFRRQVLEAVAAGRFPEPSVFELTQALGWLYRFMVVLNTPVPRCDVVHSAAAAFCSIPAVLSKIRYGTPFLLTEHGVYMREQYLSVVRQGLTPFSRRFMMQMVEMVVRLSYYWADIVSPVCRYNTRWELRMGVAPEKIRVIYNGVDPLVFAPRTRKDSPPTVVTVARIDPLKDIETLIKAAALTVRSAPGTKFIVYGAASSDEYYEQCLALRDALGLKEVFSFAGHTDDVASAYHTGDVVVLPSKSEAFPYAVIEAMMSGKAVVATEVGGTGEALADCGLLVPPGQPQALSAAILRLLRDPEYREEIGRQARQRALRKFTVQASVGAYHDTYLELAAKGRMSTGRLQTLLALRKGFALLANGSAESAASFFKKAVASEGNSAATPVLLACLANTYDIIGDVDKAQLELTRAELMHRVLAHAPEGSSSVVLE